MFLILVFSINVHNLCRMQSTPTINWNDTIQHKSNTNPSQTHHWANTCTRISWFAITIFPSIDLFFPITIDLFAQTDRVSTSPRALQCPPMHTYLADSFSIILLITRALGFEFLHVLIAKSKPQLFSQLKLNPSRGDGILNEYAFEVSYIYC